MNKIETNAEDVFEEMSKAIRKKNEKRIKELVLLAMRYYLEKKEITNGLLEDIAGMYLSIPIEEGEEVPFKFKDQKLDYIFDKLSAFSELPDNRKKEVIKRFILYLENKDYEKPIS